MGVRFASAYMQNTNREARFTCYTSCATHRARLGLTDFALVKGLIRGLNRYPDQSSLIVIIHMLDGWRHFDHSIWGHC